MTQEQLTYEQLGWLLCLAVERLGGKFEFSLADWHSGAQGAIEFNLKRTDDGGIVTVERGSRA